MGTQLSHRIRDRHDPFLPNLAMASVRKLSLQTLGIPHGKGDWEQVVAAISKS